MVTHMSGGELAMAIVYCLLTMFWFAILVIAAVLPTLRRPRVLTRSYLQIRIAFLIVSLFQFVDALYWAVTNIAHIGADMGVVSSSLELGMRNAWAIAVIKALMFASALAFFVILLRATAQLADKFEENYFSKFVDLTWDAIGILDADARVKYWNAGAERLFGWRREEVHGKHIRDFLVPPDLVLESNRAMQEIKKTGEALRYFKTCRRTSDGHRKLVDLTISPIMDSGFKGYFGVMREAAPLSAADFARFRHFTSKPVSNRQKPYAFIAMPFSTVPEDAWESIRTSVSGSGLDAIRADEDMSAGRIVDQVFHAIQYATVVIADLTGSNANVFYELGLAHALDKTVIQLIGDTDTIPFDVAGIRTIRYSRANLAELQSRLEAAIAEALRQQERAEYAAASPALSTKLNPT